MSRQNLACMVVCAALATTASAADWYPSRYGAADTLGAANNLSAEKVLAAARLVKTGKTYSLGVQTGPESPAYPPRRYSITVLQPAPGAAGLHRFEPCHRQR